MKKIAVILLGLMASFSTVRASSIFSDIFNYANGSIVANSGGIWVNNTGTAGTCLVSNQQLQITIIPSTRTEDIAHDFGTVYATNGPVTALYSSFTLTYSNLPTAGGTYFAHFTGTNAFTSVSSGLAGYRAHVHASLTNLAGTAPAGQFYLSIQNSGYGNATTNDGTWATALSTNVTYTVVTKYVLATGSSTLWINPTVEGDTSVTDPTPVPYDFGPNGVETNGPINIQWYSFRQATGEGSMLVDNLKIGTAFSDVAGANTSPTITPIPNQNTPANTAIGPINFIVGDDGGVVGLTLTNGSSNPTLVPTNNIVFGGTDPTNRTVTITPASGQQGSSTISIFVSDGVNISSTSFLLKVGAPSIAAIPNVITYSNISAGPISITLSDAEGDTMTFTKGSSNPTLLPTNNIVITGSGNSRTATLIPATDQTGVSIITLSVSDGFNTNSTSFVLSVSPRLGVLFSDTFSYTDFLQDTALYGATGSPWGHSSGTNYDLLVSNGAAMLTGARSEDLAAIISTPAFAFDSGVVLYTSFSITFSNLPTSAGDYFAHFKDTINGTTFREKVYASTANAAAGHFRIGIANAANNFTAQFPQDLNTNQTYLVVMRYNSGTGESVLWVNPNNESSTSVAAQDVTSASNIAAYGLRQADAIGTSYLDNLVIGTSFSDVATIVVTPIPIGIQQSGGNVTLNWTDGSFDLQSSTNVAGPYATISGATSPFTTNTAASQLFFRLFHP